MYEWCDTDPLVKITLAGDERVRIKAFIGAPTKEEAVAAHKAATVTAESTGRRITVRVFDVASPFSLRAEVAKYKVETPRSRTFQPGERGELTFDLPAR
jgi:hypothetical protein